MIITRRIIRIRRRRLGRRDVISATVVEVADRRRLVGLLLGR